MPAEGGVRGGNGPGEVVLQGLGLTGSGLILAGFEGGHVVERSHFHSYQSSSHQHTTKISRFLRKGLQGCGCRVVLRVVR